MALLYLVATELNESLDLEQILRRVLIAAVRVAGGTNASLFVFDEQETLIKSLFVRDIAVFDVEPEVVELLLKEGLAGWVKTHKKAALVEDATQDERTLADKNHPHLIVQSSVLSVPLLVRQKLVGILTLTHQEPSYFDTSDLTMLAAIADQAAIAILNAHLYQAEQHQRQLSNTLAEVFRQMNAIQDLDDLFDLILNQLALLVAFDRAAIFLWQKSELKIFAARGIDNLAEVQNFAIDLYQHDFARPLLKQYTPLLTPDLQKEDTWFKDVTDTNSHAWMGVPLIVGESLLGLFTIANNSTAVYTAKDLQIVYTLAGHAAIAIKNTSLLSQLQDTQRRYTHLFEESSDLLLVLDSEGVIRDANRKACQIFRRPHDVLVGSHLALLDPRLRDTFNEQSHKLMLGQEIMTEVVVRDAYGQSVALEIHARQAEIDEQTTIQWAGRDVTARHNLAALRKDLTNMIIHDLRGPMGNLMGAVQLLSMLLEEISGTSLYEEASGLVAIANRSGHHLKDLIDSVLDLSRLEQGEAFLTISSASLKQLFAEVEEQTLPQAKMKQLQLTFPDLEKDLVVKLDRSMMRRVLTNLVGNAIKYTPASGKIHVNFEIDNTTLTIGVIDNGPGIPPESQKRLFDKFTRATGDISVQGVGLGLAFCKLAVNAHQGQIWLESEVGVGSKFFFSIPLNL
jgi:PAS domain S-box-containing protein